MEQEETLHLYQYNLTLSFKLAQMSLIYDVVIPHIKYSIKTVHEKLFDVKELKHRVNVPQTLKVKRTHNMGTHI